MLVRQGIEVITDRHDLVHVSGHPRRDELRRRCIAGRGRASPCRRMASAASGRARRLRQGAGRARGRAAPATAPWCGSRPGGPRSSTTCRSGGSTRTATSLIDVGRARRAGAAQARLRRPRLGRDRDRSRRRDRRRPGRSTSWACPTRTGSGEPIADLIADTVGQVLDSLPKAKRRDPEAVENAVARAVRSAVNNVWGKKPACHVLVVEV